MKPQLIFSHESDDDIIEAHRFAEWVYETQGVACPGTGTWTGDANVLMRYHPDMFVAWRAATKIGAI